VHVTVALVLAKPAIAVTLVVGVKLLANAGAPGADGTTDGAAALGTLISGFACFAIAGLSPWVIYRLLPSVEGAAVSSGIVGGWGRAGLTAAQAGLMVKSLGASAAASAATRALPQHVSSAGSVGGGTSSAAGTGGVSSSQGTSPATGSVASTGGGASRPGASARTRPARPSVAPRATAAPPPQREDEEVQS